MPSNVLAEDVGSILERQLHAASDEFLLVNPDTESIARLVETLDGREEPPRTSLLAGSDRLKSVMEDFLVASRAADLVASETLTLRSIETPPNQSVLVADDEVTALVAVPDGVGALVTDDEAFVTAATEHYGATFGDAEPYSLRTPPLSRVRQTLEDDIGADAAADFDAVLASLDRIRDADDGLDEVTISLLVAARNRELLYDISKWGEDVGLASKATFSRTKTTLENAGLIDTEKVPIQVGRPRLRLLLGDDRLAAADPDEMATRARQLLAS